MSRGTNVTSLAALEEFDIALAVFASQSAETLESIEPEITLKTELLENRLQYWENEVEEWQSAYNSADDEEDDVSYIAYRLEQAESNLRNVCYWQGRVEEQLHEFRRRARRFQEIVIDESPRARAFVQQKLGQLRDYVGLKADAFSTVGSSGMTDTGSDAPQPAPSPDYPLDRITEMPLPSGFEWIHLKDLDPTEVSELSDLVYKKDGLGSADMMQALRLLREEVLPEIQARRQEADSDYFWQLDQKTSRQGINSLQGIYDAFFRADAIWVDRFIGQPHFRIGNGKHRIKAALDAGWPAIPARVQQASLRKGVAAQ